MDWNNPNVEHLMKNFEKIMAERDDEIASLTRLNNQLASEKEQVASRNKELEERCSNLEAKYDRLIEMYNKLLGGAGSGTTPFNPPADPNAEHKATPKQHKGGRRGRYNMRKFTGYPRQASCRRRGVPACMRTRGA